MKKLNNSLMANYYLSFILRLFFVWLLSMIIYLSPSYAAYSFQLLSFPGAANTGAFGINETGKVVGFADNFGFVYDIKSGVFTQINELSGANGINNSGEI